MTNPVPAHNAQMAADAANFLTVMKDVSKKGAWVCLFTPGLQEFAPILDAISFASGSGAYLLKPNPQEQSRTLTLSW